MTDEDYDGRERRSPTFDLVEQAAAVAAQRIARLHRRRLVVWSFLAAMVAALAIAVPVTIKLNHDRGVIATDNARFNCQQWHEGSTVLRLFVESDAKLRRDQQSMANRVEILTGFNKLFGKRVVRQLIAESARLDRDAQSYWLTSLVPRLEILATVNCSAVLTTEGPRTTPTTPDE